MGKEGELEIRPAGTDFFGDAREKLLADVCEADLEKVREATGKASLTRWTDRKEPVAILFSRQTAGGPVRGCEAGINLKSAACSTAAMSASAHPLRPAEESMPLSS